MLLKALFMLSTVKMCTGSIAVRLLLLVFSTHHITSVYSALHKQHYCDCMPCMGFLCEWHVHHLPKNMENMSYDVGIGIKSEILGNFQIGIKSLVMEHSVLWTSVLGCDVRCKRYQKQGSNFPVVDIPTSLRPENYAGLPKCGMLKNE